MGDGERVMDSGNWKRSEQEGRGGVPGLRGLEEVQGFARFFLPAGRRIL
jgi:hypothetical protein